MADDKTKINEEDMFKGGIYPLTDMETGEQVNFRFLAQADLDGNTYYAFVPVEEEENPEGSNSPEEVIDPDEGKSQQDIKDELIGQLHLFD